MKAIKLSLVLIAGFCLLKAQATIINVPEDHSTIQSAIDASVNGDTIVVSPDSYFENINFRGKNIVLTSLYYLAADTSYITATIINGSNPVHTDTASCVIINSGEDSTAVLQGFTITGGTGTKWTDIHGAGVYREGGGILIELSSPTIQHNKIINNLVTNTDGVVSTGGGGMRIGDGDPLVRNNLVIFNEAKYGAGIVLNYAGSTIANNIIASNMGGQSFHGGSGIWIAGNLGTMPKTIVNNTITNNFSTLGSGTGGISVWSATNVIIKNNIIWDNIPELQIKKISSTPQVTYSNVQGGYTGEGNINIIPAFDVLNYILGDDSPCVDMGDTSAVYNDLENPGQTGSALFPSKGLLRNDMGAYGGPHVSMFPNFQTITAIGDVAVQHVISVFPNPFKNKLEIEYEVLNDTKVSLLVFNMFGQVIASLEERHLVPGRYSNFWTAPTTLPEGTYFVVLKTNAKQVLVEKVMLIK